MEQSGARSLTPLAGKVALITGASSGIGRATAELLGRAGLKLGLLARRAERLQALAESLPTECLVLATDLRSEPAIVEAFAQLRERWGGVDVLINNAGLGHESPLMTGDTDQWREILDVNILALCICTREAVRDMRGRGDTGHVVHVSSMAGHRVPPMGGIYSASKYAVRALTEGLRQELRAAGSGIRVGSVSPGVVETEFAAHYFGSEEDARENYSRFTPLQASDVAAAIQFILSAPAHVQVHDLLVRPRNQVT